jgi:hypothetical protein
MATGHRALQLAAPQRSRGLQLIRLTVPRALDWQPLKRSTSGTACMAVYEIPGVFSITKFSPTSVSSL